MTMQKKFIIFAIVLFLSVALSAVLFKTPGQLSRLFPIGGPDHRFPDCNIILISIDTLRADHLGCYGYSRGTSPNIDRFLEECVFFEQHIANAPRTLPSHASIFTSLIPSHHGADDDRPLSEGFLTMAEILSQNGYRTVSFNDGGYVSEKFGFGQGFDLYHSFPKTSRGTLKNRVNNAMKWIRENPAGKFFMFLHTYEVHHPYTPAEDYLALFDSGYSGGLPPHITRDLLLEINDNELAIDESDKKHIIDTYDAEIKSMDESFVVLIDFLKKRELYDNTMIIFTSDHGEEFGEHGMMGWHGTTLFDEVLHVPLIVKFPDSLFSSTVIGQQVRTIDILPTVLEVCGIPEEKIFEGQSLIKMVKGKNQRLYAVSEMGGYGKSIRTSAWKYCRVHSTEMLFDLEANPEESRNLASEHPDRKTRLKGLLDSLLIKPYITVPEDKAKLDKETLDQLRDLGYIR